MNKEEYTLEERYNIKIYLNSELKPTNKKYLNGLINTLLEERVTKKDKDK